MEIVEVTCEYCLERFVVETYLPSITTTTCPHCKNETRVYFDDGEEVYHNWE